MKRIIKRVAIGLALFLVLGVSALAVAVVVRENRTFDAPYPEIAASTNPEVIERGRYLATGPAHCVDCHAAPGVPRTAEPHLVGGLAFELPIGTIYTKNITPDPTTGIGRYSDKQVARLLRYGVHPSGRAVMPFMPFANLADEDLTAIISYLRSRPPVENLVPQDSFNFLGRAAKAFLLEPEGPKGTPLATAPSGPTVERGEYIANSIANCNGCHTKRSLRTGAPIGVTFAGGLEIDSHSEPGKKFITPNLTPDPATGHITAWTEEQFVGRFKSGAVVHSGTPMPWASFGNMTEDDLRALYRYLRTLPPTPAGKDL
jgi:mono/diheme cytochrome c family protein